MAQTNFTPISLYYSTTAAAVPSASNLVAGELAINTQDGKLFYKDAAGVVQTLATKGGVGSSTNTQVLYNSSGLVVGDADFTFNGTTVTMANDASISGLTVGKGGGAVASATAVGNNAMLATNTGANNSAFGSSALRSNTSGADNTSVGLNSMYYNTTGNTNIAMGVSALQNNTTGASNIGLGYQALLSNTTASNNTAVGYQAGYSNTIGASQTFIGRNAGFATTTGGGNVFVGASAGSTNTTSANNTYVGEAAGGLTTGNGNTFLGNAAGYVVTTGAKNTIIGTYQGNQGGLDIRTASNYIVLSDGDGNPRGVFDSNGNWLVGTTVKNNDGKISITANSSINQGIVIKSTNVANDLYYIYFTNSAGSAAGRIEQSGSTTVNYVTSSDKRLKTNIVDADSSKSIIEAIRIREFDWVSGEHQKFGLIAQELIEIAPEAVSVGRDEKDSWGVDYSKLVPHLIKYVQELNAKLEAQALEIATLKGQ